jgi:hypothetical protein
MCNFWQKSVHGFSMVTHPLHNLVKKNIPFEWTEEHQMAFDALKHAITTASVLRIPQEDLPYLVETDASGVALGQLAPSGFSFKVTLLCGAELPSAQL